MSQPVLTVRNLKKSFRKGFIPKKVTVLNGVEFSIQPGTITGFLGGNGAGKTTTIKCLLDLIRPDEGEILFFGEEPPSPEVRSRIGFLPERPYFYEYLTGEEFLRFYGELSGKLKTVELKRRISSLLDRVHLSYAKDRPLGSYSKGMLQRVGIAQALIHQPQLVIFDEPMSGLDPDGRWEVTEIILETAKAGTAVFFSSHLLNDAEKICDHLVILGKGRVRFEGQTSELLVHNNASLEIRYRLQDTLASEQVQGESTLQRRIDQLRQQKADILEIRSHRQSLEEVFRQMEVEG